MFELPTTIINSVKITIHWGKTNIHREQGRLIQRLLQSLAPLICKSLCAVIIKQIIPY